LVWMTSPYGARCMPSSRTSHAVSSSSRIATAQLFHIHQPDSTSTTHSPSTSSAGAQRPMGTVRAQWLVSSGVMRRGLSGRVCYIPLPPLYCVLRLPFVLFFPFMFASLLTLASTFSAIPQCLLYASHPSESHLSSRTLLYR
jgi:hypothetical protein